MEYVTLDSDSEQLEKTVGLPREKGKEVLVRLYPMQSIYLSLQEMMDKTISDFEEDIDFMIMKEICQVMSIGSLFYDMYED